MATMTFTVIIPAYNEAECIHTTIRRIQDLAPDVQIIVADGGSSDKTAEIARKSGTEVVLAPRGRGTQCNAGAARASANILLFLHADTLLPENAFELLTAYFLDPDIQIGTFRLSFDEDSILLRFYSGFTRFDSVFTRFGDQCIVVRKSFFAELGGFPDWPLFEDVHLLRLARRRVRIISFPATVTTSARRFTKMGLIRAQWVNGWLLLLYFLNVSPVKLATFYSGERSTAKTAQNFTAEFAENAEQ